MAMAEPDISVAIRPYYWFKDDWTKPLRMTKQEKFRIEDLVFLTGQLSGICVRRSELKYPFKEKRFVEFASGVLPILKSRKSVILKHNTVAVRIDSSDARKKHVYNESPTRNWVDVVMESYSDNPKLIKYLIDKISTNYIGLIQVKSYGGLDSVLDEISLLIKLRKRNMINLKFIFYSLLVILTPSFALRYMSRWFIYNVNQWFIAHGRR
jgi:hypothetical protein